MKARKSSLSVNYCQFPSHTPGSKSGSAFPIRIRIQGSQISVDTCSSGSGIHNIVFYYLINAVEEFVVFIKLDIKTNLLCRISKYSSVWIKIHNLNQQHLCNYKPYGTV
jgi:hypothetical protein